MNLYIYICLIFFGIIIFLLWNHKNKFSIGGQDDPNCPGYEDQCIHDNFQEHCPDMCKEQIQEQREIEYTNEILDNIDNCNDTDFAGSGNYATRGANNKYGCCGDIKNILEQDKEFDINVNPFDQTTLLNDLKKNNRYLSYNTHQQKNILEYILGCGHSIENFECSKKQYVNILYNDHGQPSGFNITCGDSCYIRSCEHNGYCEDNGYCDCDNTGYTGNFCEMQVEESATEPCEPNPCLNNGSCLTVSSNERRCKCPPG